MTYEDKFLADVERERLARQQDKTEAEAFFADEYEFDHTPDEFDPDDEHDALLQEARGGCPDPD